MSSHRALLLHLVAAIQGEKTAPVGIKGGSVNYKLMEKGTRVILDPSPANQTAFLDLLRQQKREGHLTLRGPRGVACEAGSPSMHWSFNAGPIVGVALWACKRNQPELRSACVEWIADEVGLNRWLWWKDGAWLPCPRLKREKGQSPNTKYRDRFTRMAAGEDAEFTKLARQKDADYWAAPEAVAVATMRALRPLLTKDELERIRTSPPPKLYLPILKKELPGGGFLAYIEDTPEARQAMGKDSCNWVRCAPEGITFGVDWEALPTDGGSCD